MLCVGVAACHRYGVCTVCCVECTQHSAQYTQLPHHGIKYKEVVFTEFEPKYNFS